MKTGIKKVVVTLVVGGILLAPGAAAMASSGGVQNNLSKGERAGSFAKAPCPGDPAQILAKTGSDF